VKNTKPVANDDEAVDMAAIPPTKANLGFFVSMPISETTRKFHEPAVLSAGNLFPTMSLTTPFGALMKYVTLAFKSAHNATSHKVLGVILICLPVMRLWPPPE